MHTIVLRFHLYIDGLRNTREWLHRNRSQNQQPSASPGVSNVQLISSVLVNAFLELLVWDENHPWPEVSLECDIFA